MSDAKEGAYINHQNTPNDEINCRIRDDLAKAYQQSVDILNSLVDNLMTAGIIDLSDHSYTVLKDRTGKTGMNAQIQDLEAIIQGLGEVYYSVLLVDYQHDHVTVFRHEEEAGQDIADLFAKYDFCWSEGLAQYCLDLASEDSCETLKRALSVENLEQAETGFSVNYQRKSGNSLQYLEAMVASVNPLSNHIVPYM